MISVKIDHGKYTIIFHEAQDPLAGQLEFSRYETKQWMLNPPGSKMWIPVMYEIADSRALLEEIASQYPNTEIADKIKNHFEIYGR